MSYDLQVRNAPTGAEYVIELKKQQQNLGTRAKLNYEYDQAAKTRQENDKLNVVPLAPEFRTKDEVMADLTLQKEILKQNLTSIMPYNEAMKFIGRVFNNYSTILMVNRYFKDIEREIPKDVRISASFFKGFIDRFFITQERGVGVEPVVIPPDYSVVQNVLNHHAIQAVDLRGDELVRAVRTVIKQNYPSAIGIDIDSPAYDNQILRFYVSRKVIPATSKLKESDWLAIYNYETRKHEGDLEDLEPIPFAKIGNKGPAKKESSQEELIRQIREMERPVITPDNKPKGPVSVGKATASAPSYTPAYTPIRTTTPASGSNTIDKARYGFLGPQGRQQGSRRSGYGFVKGNRSNGMKIGRGIEENESSKTKYYEFGRYVIHIPSLKRNVLHLKYKSLGMIPNIPKQFISSELANTLLDLVENKKLNSKLYDGLNNEDKKIFCSICTKAETEETLGFGLKVDDDERDEFDKFQLLRGEVVAGNNNPKVLSQVKSYILKFMSSGRIKKSEGYGILAELALLI